MRKKITCIAAFFASVTLGAAPAVESPIDRTKNVIEGAQHLGNSFRKLSSLKRWGNSRFVVVHFGDSHIQGDYFSGMIRRNLHETFGDGGEGILFPYSLCKSFGPRTLTSGSTGVWTWATLLKNPEQIDVGVTGYTLRTKDSTATLTFNYTPEDSSYRFEEVSFWYSGTNATVLLKNPAAGVSMIRDTAMHGNGMSRMVVHGYKPGTNISFRLKPSGKKSGFDFSFFGISFDRSDGIQYNRCGVVGATFLHLTEEQLQGVVVHQLKELHPDLIIYSYGSNESYNQNLDMRLYTLAVDAYIGSIRKEFPSAEVVITSPPDTRSGGRFPKHTQAITDSLRSICTKQHCAFWDMRAVMGGDNSIHYWLNNGLARKDKLHFTKAGYELQGNLFSQALLQAYNTDRDSSSVVAKDKVDAAVEEQLAKLKAGATALAPIASGEKTHTVAKGETLSSIARANNVTVDQLCEWNSMKKTDVLKIGQKLVIKK